MGKQAGLRFSLPGPVQYRSGWCRSKTAAGRRIWERRGYGMHSPYGFELAENCLVCQLRTEKFFCNLPAPALKMLDQIKQVTAYPKGAVLFTEGQSPRGVFILCRGRVKMSI